MGRKPRTRQASSCPPTTERIYIDLSDDAVPLKTDLTQGILVKAEKRGRKRLRAKAGAEVVALQLEENGQSDGRDAEEQGGAASDEVLKPDVELGNGELNEAGHCEAEVEPEAPVVKATEKKKKKKKKKKQQKKKKGKKETTQNELAMQANASSSAVDMEDSKPAPDEPAESKLLDAAESLAMRKLLRSTRYFDPPEDHGETCYNCGQQGHWAAECTKQAREKPCYVCGNFGHFSYDCPEKTECYECGSTGHVARSCPNKQYLASNGTGVCLLCGRLGHDKSACSGECDLQDFEQVRCYICKRTGHMCCIDVSDASPTPVSCYRCGDLGHSGVACNRLSMDNRDQTACYRCGNEGHFARECQRSRRDCYIKKRRHSWPAPWSADNGTNGEQHPVTPESNVECASFKSRLEQESSGKKKQHSESKKKHHDESKKKHHVETKKEHPDESRKGPKRKRKESED